MKKLSILFLICFAGSSFAQQGWFIVSSDNENSGGEIAFPSADTGYFSYGVIKKTFDGGKSWKDANAPYLFYPHHPFFLDSKTGFFLDGDSAVIRTTNAGQSWDRFSIHNANLKVLTWMYFENPVVGFITGHGDPNFRDSGILMKTIDSGKTWIQIFSMALNDAQFNQVIFRDSLHGYLIASELNMDFVIPFLLITTDGGFHWKKKQTYWGYDLYYAKSLKLWFGFSFNNVYRWSEDETVQEIDTVFKNIPNNTEEISSMSFANDSVGYVVTIFGKIYKTTNSGVTWFLQSTPKEFDFGDRIVAPSEKIAYALNDSVIIKTIDGGGPPVNSVKNISGNPKFSLLSNPITSSADFQFDALKESSVFELFDLLGRSLLRQQLSAGLSALHIDMQKYSAGIYFARLGGATVRFIKLKA